MSKKNNPELEKNLNEFVRRTGATKSFCLLWVHLSTRPNGHMRVCCTANASSVGPTNDKEHGGEVGVLKQADGKTCKLKCNRFNVKLEQ